MKIVLILSLAVFTLSCASGRSQWSCRKRTACMECARTSGCAYVYGIPNGSSNATFTCSSYGRMGFSMKPLKIAKFPKFCHGFPQSAPALQSQTPSNPVLDLILCWIIGILAVLLLGFGVWKSMRAADDS